MQRAGGAAAGQVGGSTPTARSAPTRRAAGTAAVAELHNQTMTVTRFAEGRLSFTTERRDAPDARPPAPPTGASTRRPPPPHAGRLVAAAGPRRGPPTPTPTTIATRRSGAMAVSSAELAELNDSLRRGENASLAEGKLQLLLESTGEGIYGIDLDGRCTFVNRAAVQLLGFSRDELLGQNMHELIHHHHHADGTPHPVGECPILPDAVHRPAVPDRHGAAVPQGRLAVRRRIRRVPDPRRPARPRAAGDGRHVLPT